MLINSDYGQRAVVHGGRVEGVPSPMPGVERKMLDRVGDEVARATSIVTYAADSSFSAHTHDGGEEFLVLDGVFQDDHGDYPAGTYVRNPPTSRHVPRSQPGCTILVKLHQFDPSDRTFARMDINKMGRVPDPERPGVDRTPLYVDERERVEVLTLSPGTEVRLADAGGLELFVVDGEPEVDGEAFSPQSWLRLPPSEMALIKTEGCARLWVKTGHLRPEVLKTGAFAAHDFGVK